MAAEMPEPGSVRPGGRTARTRAAVREATLAELAEHGYRGLSVENVAARSGVHKTTVYRRWGNAEGLVADALELAGEEPWPVPDTGSAENDLRELARLVHSGFADPELGPVSTAFIAAAVQHPSAATSKGAASKDSAPESGTPEGGEPTGGVAAALHAFVVRRQQDAAVIVTRAVERGELPPGTDAAEVVRSAVAPLYYRLFISGEPVDRATADRAGSAAFAAARAGVFVSGPDGA
ncbi:TetR/AcrR family transcriptional regulator [Spirillospora sp. NPDC048911]|uniref:TetR/AcrR family transcriptional regulator n=1 Tax=Spirillospora sp. NPDC048911 TaxID=3364527 RepID=UPI00371619C1